MPKNSNNNVNAMREHLNNMTFGKTVLEGLDNIAKTKTAVVVNVSDLYSSPTKWNFYDPLDDNKKYELMNSIQENGILSPIIVWQVDYEEVEDEYGEDEIDAYDFEGNKYLILAGHNRTDAINRLHQITGEDKYLTIPAFIFKKDELTIESAREIIIDTNYVQRVLSTKEKVKSVLYKYAEIEKNKTKKGKVRDLVAEELGLSPITVYNYIKLSSIIDEFQEMVYNDKLTLTSILKLSDKTREVQKWVYEQYGDRITSKALNKIKTWMKRDDIGNVLEKELTPKTKTKKVSIDVPEDLIDEFKEMAYQWIYNKTKRD